MNGSGVYKHFTGYYYDGQFVNGLPNNLLITKLDISIENCSNVDNKLKIVTNKSYKIKVKSVIDDTDQVFVGWCSIY